MKWTAQISSTSPTVFFPPNVSPIWQHWVSRAQYQGHFNKPEERSENQIMVEDLIKRFQITMCKYKILVFDWSNGINSEYFGNKANLVLENCTKCLS